MENLTEQKIRQIIKEETHPRFERLEDDVSTLKNDVSTLKSDVSTLKGDVRENRVMLEQTRDDIQKILEIVTTLVEQNDQNSNLSSKVKSNDQKIHVNKIVLKDHISDDNIHLDPS